MSSALGPSLRPRLGKWLRIICLLAFVALLPGGVGAHPLPVALDLADVQGQIDLTPHLATLIDPSRALTLAEVTTPARSQEWQPAGNTVPNFGMIDDAVWVTFAVHNSGAEPAAWVVNLDMPAMGSVTWFPPGAMTDPTAVVQTGTSFAFSSRPIPSRSFAFPVEVAPGATDRYYVRLESQLPVRAPLNLWAQSDFTANRIQDDIWWTVVMALLVIMAVYNVLTFIVVRDVDYLLLAALAIAIAVSTGFAFGFYSRWFGADLAPRYAELTVTALGLVVVTFGAFALSFLELRARLRVAFWAALVCMGVMLFGMLLIPLGQIRLAAIIAFGVLLPLQIIVIAAAAYLATKGYRPALYLLVAMGMSILLGIFQTVSIFGATPWLPGYPFATPLNNLFMVVLMSLALADRINALQQETRRANLALAASEQRLAAYLDALPFEVVVHDARLNPIYSNQAMRDESLGVETMWADGEGKAPTPARGSALRVSGTDEVYPLERLPLLQATHGVSAHVDDLAVVQDGHETPLATWSVPLHDDQGQITAIISTFEDISQRRATELELAEHRARLEQRVAQRTSELSAVNADLAQRVAELSAINAIGQRLARAPDLQATLKAVAHLAANLFQVHDAVITLFHEQREQTLIISSARPEGMLPAHQRAAALEHFDISQSFAAALREPTVIEDFAQLNTLTDDLRARIQADGVKRLLLAPLLVRNATLGVLTLASTDAERTFTPNDLRLAQTIAGLIAASVDTQRLLTEERRQRQTAEALRQTTVAISRSLDQQTVLGTILQQLAQVLVYEGAAIALVEGDVLQVVDAEGLSKRVLGEMIGMGCQAAPLRVVHTGKPLLIADTEATPYRDQCCTTPPVRSWLGAPLVSSDRVIGVLSVESTRPGVFVASQAEVLAVFASQAVVAVTNARLYQQAQVAAAARERERIARDLHDAVTQTIFSASLLAETMPLRLGPVAPDAAEALDLLHKLTKGALAEMRMLLLELRPEHLSAAPLPVLIEHLAEAFTGRIGTAVNVHVSGDAQRKLPEAVKLAFYRIAQEALNNVGKHANAANVTVNLNLRPGSVRMAVLDDGCGFATEAVAPERLGMTILHERAQEVGALLTVDSAPGLGTHIHLVWNESEERHAD